MDAIRNNQYVEFRPSVYIHQYFLLNKEEIRQFRDTRRTHSKRHASEVYNRR